MSQLKKSVRILDAVFIEGEPVDVGAELEVEVGLANRLIGSNKAEEIKSRGRKAEK